MSEKTNNGINVKQNLGKDLTDRNSEIAASLFNRFVANEDDQFECNGIFNLNKWSDNETVVKNGLLAICLTFLNAWKQMFSVGRHFSEKRVHAYFTCSKFSEVGKS